MTLEAFSGKKIVVTGSSGYLASNLIGQLSGVNCSVLALSCSGKVTGLGPSGRAEVKFQKGDLSSSALWEESLRGADVVFHFAAQTSVYVAETNPIDDFGSNVVPILRLLETCRRCGYRPAVLFAGTVTQVGVPDRVPVDESFVDNPVTVYDTHKLFAEKYLALFCRQGFVNGGTLRLPNLYGPGPKSSRPDRGVLNGMVLRALAGEPLKIYGTGEVLRDYLFVDDAVSAFLCAYAFAGKMGGRSFVLGTGKGRTIADAFRFAANQVKKMTGRSVSVGHVPAPSGLSSIEHRNFVADARLFQTLTGWSPRVSFEDGVSRTISFYERKGGAE